MHRLALTVAGVAICTALAACAAQTGAGDTRGTATAEVILTPTDPVPTPAQSSTTKRTPELNPSMVSPPPSGEITLTGTVVAGVETGCLLIEGYLIVNGDPAVVKPGRRVRVTGRVDHDIASYCQQGIPFVVTSAEPA